MELGLTPSIREINKLYCYLPAHLNTVCHPYAYPHFGHDYIFLAINNGVEIMRKTMITFCMLTFQGWISSTPKK